MVKCGIKFNNSEKKFVSGEKIAGFVELESFKVTKITELSIKVEGFSSCQWGDVSTTRRSLLQPPFKSSAVHLSKSFLLESAGNGNEINLTAGVNMFAFSFDLPSDLRSTFLSMPGATRYRIIVGLEIPGKSMKNFEFDFHVTQYRDLNFDNSLRSPQNVEFWLDSTLCISANIPKSGFVPGDSVPVMIKMMNESNVSVESTKISLKQIVHYTSGEHVLKLDNTMAKTYYEGVKANSSASIEVSLIIPEVISSSIGTHDIIHISYEIRVTAKVGFFRKEFNFALPITIGTVPFHTSPPEYPLLQQDDSALPSYEKAMAMMKRSSEVAY